MLIEKLFRALIDNPTLFLKADTGNEFENRVMNYLKTKLPFTRLMPDEATYIQTIKNRVLNDENEHFIKNTTDIKRGFVYQPYGSQKYPDFLVFDDDYIVPIEIKFSTSTKSGQGNKPMWNSGLPRLNGIYIYGSLPRKSIAVFYGADIITKEQRIDLLGFFDDLKEQQEEFNESKMQDQKYGFVAYSRKAFEQKKKINPNAKISLIDERENLAEKLMERLKRHA